MKGLILKELYLIKSNMRSLIIMLFCFLLIVMNDATSIAFVLPLFSVMMCITTFTYDEYNKWDSYAISMPTGRKDIVRGKYLTTIILIIISAVISLLTVYILGTTKGSFDLCKSLFSLGGGIVGILFFVALLYPFIYKFGIEKGRLLILVVAFALSGIIGMIFTTINLSNLLSFLYKYGMYIIPLLSLIVIYISYKISMKLYLRKEF